MAELTPLETPDASPGARRVTLLGIVLLIAAVALGIYVGTNVLGVLFAVIAPPLPPTPPNLDQVSHTSAAYGVDDWTYVSTGDACTLAQYVQSNGGTCQIAPLSCGDTRATSPNGSVGVMVVARCSGQMAFSIFNEQWSSLVSLRQDGKAQIEIHREVYWIGTGPQ